MVTSWLFSDVHFKDEKCDMIDKEKNLHWRITCVDIFTTKSLPYDLKCDWLIVCCWTSGSKYNSCMLRTKQNQQCIQKVGSVIVCTRKEEKWGTCHYAWISQSIVEWDLSMQRTFHSLHSIPVALGLETLLVVFFSLLNTILAKTQKKK